MEKTSQILIDTKKIATCLFEQGISKSGLARLSKLDRTTIMVAFRTKKATARTINKIASVLKIKSSDIIMNDDTENIIIASDKPDKKVNKKEKTNTNTEQEMIRAHYIDDKSFGEQIFAREDGTTWVATKCFPMVGGGSFSNNRNTKYAKSTQIFRVANPRNNGIRKLVFFKTDDINVVKKNLIPAIANSYCEFVKKTANTIPEEKIVKKEEKKSASTAKVIVQDNTIVVDELKKIEAHIIDLFKSFNNRIDDCIKNVNKQSESMSQGYVNLFNAIETLNKEIKRCLEVPDRLDEMLAQLSGIEKPIDNAAKISDSVKKIATLQREIELMRYSINELSAQIISNKAKAA